LTRDIQDVPFDLRGLYCHEYDPHSKQGLRRLARIVRRAAEEVRATSLPTMLQGVLARTKQIVQYMEHCRAARTSLNSLVIRVQAGLSSIANTGFSAAEDSARREYGHWLEKERDQLLRLLEGGATLQAILCPPVRHRVGGDPDRWRRRFDLLLEFLTRRTDCLARCSFVLSVEEATNLLFFGEEILFEGHKTGIEGGYGWTMIYTTKGYIQTRLAIFDMLFQSARNYTMATYGKPSPDTDERAALFQAVIRGVERARDGRRAARQEP
jgi:hypothetical protein